MDKIRSLLNQVAIINNKNQELIDSTGGRFNIFRLCGVNHYENTHSSIIAEFLNPKGTHGLKSKFLDCFLEILENELLFDFNTSNARISTEYSTSEGRIDILIEDDNNKAIIIENKIYAKDQYEQLKRYNHFASKKYGDKYRIIYLNLYGNEASEQSGNDVDYIAVSYRDHIVSWLEKCVEISSRFPTVRETIIQYITHLKQLTNTDMNQKNTEEVTAILAQTENLRTARDISRNYSATFDLLARKYFNPIMEEFAKENDLKYVYEKSEEAYIRFYFSKPKWGEECWPAFSFYSNRYYYGICHKPDTKWISGEVKDRIQEKINAVAERNCSESSWWPVHYYIKSLTLDEWENDIINSQNFANDCKNKIKMLLDAIECIEV